MRFRTANHVLLACLVTACARLQGQECAPLPSAVWKNTVDFPDDPFRAEPPGELPRWIKFTILACDPTRVYFQNSLQVPFHYDFATQTLPPFAGMSQAEFEAATLHSGGQLAVLGAVLFPPLGDFSVVPEFGIQLIRLDPYPPEDVVRYFDLVRAAVAAPAGTTAYYFPTFEQTESARLHAEFLAARGVIVSSAERWSRGNACYSDGWALGTLRFVEAARIDEAYATGEIRPADILLTDAVPAEIPFFAGVITLGAATPNSHVAILASGYGIPFAHLAVAADAARAEELAGRRVILRVYERFGECDVRLHDIEGVLDDETIAELLALKELPELDFEPLARAGSYSLPVDGLGPEAIGLVGGKAANYGLLREAIPANAPVAMAFTFDLWLDFLAQTLGNGKTLRATIAERLAPHDTFPPADLGRLIDDLDAVRDLIKDPGETAFPAPLSSAVLEALADPRYAFDPEQPIRFRSSTNFEDSQLVTGAGLYESFSGCLQDELDPGEEGPSICFPDEPEERGVFRAIRKVFASFYGLNPYLERRRWDVSEDAVGMALLVHHSFPDEIELANGVATLTRQFETSYEIAMVSQKGAVSVANPEGGAIPEEVAVSVSSFGPPQPTLVRPSNLVVLGDTVLAWEAEYRAFAQLFAAVAEAFARATGKSGFVLDFEYKKTAPGGALVVKQVREIPRPDAAPAVTPFLLAEPVDYCVFQGEFGDVWSNHNLKSTWRLGTRSMWLTAENLAEGLYDEVELGYTDGCDHYEFAGAMSSLPEHTVLVDGNSVRHRWTFPSLANPRRYALVTADLPLLVSAAESPILTQRDLAAKYVEVEFDEPVLGQDFEPEFKLVRSQAVVLEPCREPLPGDVYRERTIEQGGVTITTRFYHEPPPGGIVAGYTAPLSRWVETVVAGVAAAPFTVRGDEAQSYRPEHHNFQENFIFAPRLDPSLAPGLLAELTAAGVHQIYGRWDPDGNDRVFVLGEAEVGHICVEGPPAMFVRGDCDGDGQVSGVVTDAVFLLTYLFLGGARPRCLAACDVDGDGSVAASVTDAVWLLSFNFLGGIAPPAPFPECGSGTDADRALGCGSGTAGCR